MTTTKWLLTWLCMCPANESPRLTRRIAYVGVTSIIFIANLCAFATQTTFFIKIVLTDLEAALFALFGILYHVAMPYTLINAFYLRCKIGQIFTKLSEICCKSK